MIQQEFGKLNLKNKIKMNFEPHFDEIEFEKIDLSNIDFENQKIYLFLFVEMQMFYKKIWKINYLLQTYKIN